LGHWFLLKLICALVFNSRRSIIGTLEIAGWIPGSIRIMAMARVALTSAQCFSRYQSLRMDLPKSTGRLFAISASRSWIFTMTGFRGQGEMQLKSFSRSVSSREQVFDTTVLFRRSSKTRGARLRGRPLQYYCQAIWKRE